MPAERLSCGARPAAPRTRHRAPHVSAASTSGGSRIGQGTGNHGSAERRLPRKQKPASTIPEPSRARIDLEGQRIERRAGRGQVVRRRQFRRAAPHSGARWWRSPPARARQLRLLADAGGRREVSRIQPGSGQVDGRRGLGRRLFMHRAPGIAASCRSVRIASNGSNSRRRPRERGHHRRVQARQADQGGRREAGARRTDVAAQARCLARRNPWFAAARRSATSARSRPPTSTDSCCAINAARAAAIAASRARSLTSGASDCSAHRPRQRSRRLVARQTLDRRRACAPDAALPPPTRRCR